MQLLHPATTSHLQDNFCNLSLMLIITVMIIDIYSEDIFHLLLLGDAKEGT